MTESIGKQNLTYGGRNFGQTLWRPLIVLFDSASLAEKQVPLPNLIGLIDGNFMVICRPMGLGTLHANKDLHSGKEGHTV